MELQPGLAFKPLPIGETVISRLEGTEGADHLALLSDLIGKWEGTGFNAIWRPNHGASDHFLELNFTKDVIEFAEIPGEIPNRGFLQGDVMMRGIRYLQQISDANIQGVFLHIEPGIWAVVPATTNPEMGPTVVRMSTIPHGAAILAQGAAQKISGPPSIGSSDLTPFTVGNPTSKIPFSELDLTKAAEFRTPIDQISGISQELLNNPNSLLTQAINKQTIISTTVLNVTTTDKPVDGGSAANTAFLQGRTGANAPNAQVAQVDSTLWIEQVTLPTPCLQLQYTQTVLLNFAGLSWPHVSVATLVKQLGS